jgi:hypothetical protein
MGNLRQAPLATFVMLIIAALPLIAGIVCAIAPNEKRLALMRPLSLAAIFAGLSSLLLGLANAFMAGARAAQSAHPPFLQMVAESLIPAFMAFSFLTVAWVCVAIATRRS